MAMHIAVVLRQQPVEQGLKIFIAACPRLKNADARCSERMETNPDCG